MTEYTKEYYQNHREEILGKAIEYYQKNKESIMIKRKKHYQKNRDRILEQARQYAKEYYQENKDKVKEKDKQNTRAIKMKVLRYYGGDSPICACCKEAHVEFLCIDHVNGNGNQHRKRIGKTGKGFYRWLIRNNYPEGFRVLCHNCNASLGHYGYCPHDIGKI